MSMCAGACQSARSRVDFNSDESPPHGLGLDADGPGAAARVKDEITFLGARLEAFPNELPRQRCIRLISDNAFVWVGHVPHHRIR